MSVCVWQEFAEGGWTDSGSRTQVQLEHLVGWESSKQGVVRGDTRICTVARTRVPGLGQDQTSNGCIKRDSGVRWVAVHRRRQQRKLVEGAGQRGGRSSGAILAWSFLSG